MFYLLFGNYLVEHKVITNADYLTIKHKLPNTSVKLGVMAVSEGLLTHKQAQEINHVQEGSEKCFCDIAQEMQYLTKEQIDNLLLMQENNFMKFLQAMLDGSNASLETIMEYLTLYQADNGYTNSQMALLRSDNIDEALPVLLHISDPMPSELICLTVRNLIRFIDPHVYVSKSVITDEYACENLAIQSTVGDHQIQLGFSGNSESLLQIANAFAGEEFEEIDADSYDAICEFINCINGVYASKLCDHDINIDMLPPFYYTYKTLQCKNLIVVTVHITDNTFDLILSIDSPIEYL